jgi:hypothetical protein
MRIGSGLTCGFDACCCCCDCAAAAAAAATRARCTASCACKAACASLARADASWSGLPGCGGDVGCGGSGAEAVLRSLEGTGRKVGVEPAGAPGAPPPAPTAAAAAPAWLPNNALNGVSAPLLSAPPLLSVCRRHSGKQCVSALQLQRAHRDSATHPCVVPGALFSVQVAQDGVQLGCKAVRSKSRAGRSECLATHKCVCVHASVRAQVACCARGRVASRRRVRLRVLPS